MSFQHVFTTIITIFAIVIQGQNKIILCVCCCISSRELVNECVFHHSAWVTHSNRSRRRICKRLMKQEMQSSLVFWLRRVKALRAASWTLSRSPKLPVCEGEINFQLLLQSLPWEERSWKRGGKVFSCVDSLSIKTGSVVLVFARSQRSS